MDAVGFDQFEAFALRSGWCKVSGVDATNETNAVYVTPSGRVIRVVSVGGSVVSISALNVWEVRRGR